MSKPIIAIAGQTESAEDSFSVKRRYVSYLQRAGGYPIVIPTTAAPDDVTELLQCADGILLPGGYSIDPALYGEQPDGAVDPFVPERDAFERAIVDLAFTRDMPLLGLCRGMQMINVAFGGSLHQHLGGAIEHWRDDATGSTIHDVEIAEDTPLAAIVGGGFIGVNSVHRQGVARLAEGLKAAAVAPDGLIEAIYHPERTFFVGVQWHPEFMPEAKPSLQLASAFIDVCRSRRL